MMEILLLKNIKVLKRKKKHCNNKECDNKNCPNHSKHDEIEEHLDEELKALERED